jgi:hypothetical protein
MKTFFFFSMLAGITSVNAATTIDENNAPRGGFQQHHSRTAVRSSGAYVSSIVETNDIVPEYI